MTFFYLSFTDGRVIAKRHHLASPWLLIAMVSTLHSAKQQVV
jgi:hypothetical protein